MPDPTRPTSDVTMSADETAIRALVAAWMTASKTGDTAKVLGMMTDDVVFLVPGQAPFGKAAFAEASKAMDGALIDGSSEIEELKIAGDWAFMRGFVRVVVTPPGGNPVERAGHTLTVFARQPDGRWLLARDANFVAPVPVTASVQAQPPA